MIPFVGPTYQGRSRDFTTQRCVNWYVETMNPPDKTPMALYPTPGLKLWKALGSTPIRGMHVIQQGSSAGANLYVVMGDTLYSIDSTKTETSLGTLNSGSGIVTMSDNGTDLVISDGAYQSSTAETYSYETDNNDFKKLTDSTDDGYDEDAPRSTHCAFLDGYIFLNKVNTGEVYISDSYDASSYAGTYATAESDPDNLVGILATYNELWLLGENNTEIWYNAGVSGFPLNPIPNAVVNWGLAAPRAVSNDAYRLYWLAKNKQGQFRAVATEGYNAVPISNAQIENAWAKYSTFTDAHSFLYFQEGHTFWVLTFPTEQATWVYDTGTGMWHERSSVGHGRWIPSCHAFCFNKNLVGDYQTGNIYELDLGTYTDNGTTIIRSRRSQHQQSDVKSIFWRIMEVDFEPGVGLVSGQGSNPQAMLRWSDDGGHTWSNEHWADIGKIGAFKTRARWKKLGRSRDRVWELSVSDPVKAVVLGASAEASVGRT